MMAFVLMMTGCSVSNTPEDVAVKFMEALHSCDFKEAMNYCSEGSKGAMEKQIAFFEEMKKKGPLEITEPSHPKHQQFLDVLNSVELETPYSRFSPKLLYLKKHSKNK